MTVCLEETVPEFAALEDTAEEVVEDNAVAAEDAGAETSDEEGALLPTELTGSELTDELSG